MRCFYLLMTFLILVSSTKIYAAPITWGSPFEIVTDADLELSFGPVLYAINGGDYDGPIEELDPVSQSFPSPPTNLVVGSKTIPLEWTQVNTGPGSKFDSATFGEVIDHLPGDNQSVSLSTFTEREPEVLGDFDDALFDGLFVRADDVGGTVQLSATNRIYQPDVAEPGNSLTGNTTLDSVLNSSIWTDGRTTGLSTLIVDLNLLEAGKDYQVQIVANADTREPRGTKQERNVSAFTVNDDEGNSSAELGVFRDLDSDGFRHVNSLLGTFTADDVTQRINLVHAFGRNPGFSLLIVSEVAGPGDFNADGVVNGEDFLKWQRGESWNALSSGDLATWRTNYGSSATATTARVPEPTGLVLLTLSACWGAGFVTRNR